MKRTAQNSFSLQQTNQNNQVNLLDSLLVHDLDQVHPLCKYNFDFFLDIQCIFAFSQAILTSSLQAHQIMELANSQPTLCHLQQL
jgi:hypothetical protein